MLWLVRGYITQEEGVETNWMKAVAFISRKKA
jgi:hypothetical protein